MSSCYDCCCCCCCCCCYCCYCCYCFQNRINWSFPFSLTLEKPYWNYWLTALSLFIFQKRKQNKVYWCGRRRKNKIINKNYFVAVEDGRNFCSRKKLVIESDYYWYQMVSFLDCLFFFFLQCLRIRYAIDCEDDERRQRKQIHYKKKIDSELRK